MQRMDVIATAIRLADKRGLKVVPLDIFSSKILGHQPMDAFRALIAQGERSGRAHLNREEERTALRLLSRVELERVLRSHAMGKRIIKHRPDLVVVGNAHALDLHEALRDDYAFEFDPERGIGRYPGFPQVNAMTVRLRERMTRKLKALRRLRQG